MRHSILAICTLLLVLSGAGPAMAQSIERSGPWRLVCLKPDGLVEHVGQLTRQQLIGIIYAESAGEVKWPCDSVRLSVGTTWTGHGRWLRTEDGWWVHALTVRYPNGSIVVTVDPMQAQFRRKPLEFWNFFYFQYSR